MCKFVLESFIDWSDLPEVWLGDRSLKYSGWDVFSLKVLHSQIGFKVENTHTSRKNMWYHDVKTGRYQLSPGYCSTYVHKNQCLLVCPFEYILDNDNDYGSYVQYNRPIFYVRSDSLVEFLGGIGPGMGYENIGALADWCGDVGQTKQEEIIRRLLTTTDALRGVVP